VTRFPYEIDRLAQDVAGGLLVTHPSEKDMKAPEISRWPQKYSQGKTDIPAEYRVRILQLIENLTLGAVTVGHLTESMYGRGFTTGSTDYDRPGVGSEQKVDHCEVSLWHPGEMEILSRTMASLTLPE
jgi:aromatic ring hydroxylase